MPIAPGQDGLAADVLALTLKKLKSETRDYTAASGDVAYTGYGFQPTALIIIASGGAVGGTSIGLGDVNLAEMCFLITGTDLDGLETSEIVHISETEGSKEQTAVLKTLDADGFTLTWTKLGITSAATLTMAVLAIR